MLRAASIITTRDGATELDFATAVDRHLTAVTERDLDSYLATVHDDVTLVTLNGRVVKGRQAVGDLHRDWFADPDWSWQLTGLHTSETGDAGTALFTVDYNDLDRAGKPYSLRYLLGLTFARGNGTWLLLHDQNTPVS
jgi:uncharacterized protein (TIGR02246 family)